MAPLPTLTTLLSTLLSRTASPLPSPLTLTSRTLNSNPLSKRNLPDPGAGVTPFDRVPNKAIFALFGLIGVFFVVTGIWFFFWAKNGGFYFHENDWDDYKTTVLRRRGPNGTLLSGASQSTDLGGESVKGGRSVWGRKKKGRKAGEKRYTDFDEETAYTGSAGGSSLGSELSELKKEKRRKEKPSKEKVSKPKKSRFHRAPTTDVDHETETVADPTEDHVDPSVQDAMRAYRHEKPARVGGLNKPADGSHWDGSTEASVSEVLINHREPTPTNTPTKVRKERNDKYTGGNGGGIRKVVSTSQPPVSSGGHSSFWNRGGGGGGTNSVTTSRAEEEAAAEHERERERIRAEARKLQEKGRAASSHASGRRDFSFQPNDDSSTVISSSTASTEDREARRQARRERHHRREESKGRSGSPKKLSVPGSYYEEGSDLGTASVVSGESQGTKSYHHPIPGLSVRDGNGGKERGGEEYREERRKRRAARENGGGGGGGGYRRGRRDSLE